MESLYRKYRPLTFESVVGQQHIVSTLKHAVAEGRLSHAYLFCGPRGTGKTTMARILAKSLLCEGSEAARVTGASGCMPDGTCPECEAIAAGTHPDVYELDAASRTGVDNVREEIINSVSFAPVRGAYKVYIIDEVHMLTTAAFNALLKTLEEPPSHVVFVLCTTDPQKILETILSRCQRFDFHRISNEDIVGRLRFICEQEGFAFDEEALEIVARHARGGMRDALSTLEQLSVFGDGSVHVDDARSLLGEVASTVLSEFACKIAVRDTVGLFGLVRVQADEGNDLMELTHDLVAHVRDVYTAAIAGPKTELFDGTPEEVAALVEEARLFEGADRLARALTVLDDAALEMRNASDPRLVLEIALTRLARPETDLTLEALAERLARLEAQLAVGVPSGPMDAAQLAAAAGPHGGAPNAVLRAGAATSHAAAVPSAASAAPVVPNSASAAAPTPVSSPTADPCATQGPARASSSPVAASGAVDVSPSVRSSTSGSAAAPRSAQSGSAPAPRPAAPAAAASNGPVSAPTAAAPAAAVPAPAAQPVTGAVTQASPSAPRAQIVSAPASQTASAGAERPAAQGAPASPARASAPQESITIAADSQPEMAACPVTPPAADAGDLQRRWADAVKRITAEQPSRGGLLQSSRAVSDDGETLTIGFPKGSTFALKMITRPDSSQLVMPIICQVFGKRSVTYVMEGAAKTPAAPASASAPTQAPTPAAAPSTAQTMPPASSPVPAASAPAAPGARRVASPAPAGSAPAQASTVVMPPTSAVPAPAAVPAASTPSPAAASPAAPAASASVPAAASSSQVEPSPQPSPSAVDQATGPTILSDCDIEADRKAWEDEMPPYDDAFIASYEGDDEVPPFDVPAEASSVDSSSASAERSVGNSAPAAQTPAAHSSAPTSSSTPAPMPSAPASGAPIPPVASASTDATPPAAPMPSLAADSDAEADPKAVLESIWGNVVFK